MIKARNNERLSKKDVLKEPLEKMEEVIWYGHDYNDAANDLGLSYIEAKEYDRAIEFFLLAIALDPTDIDARYGLAIASAETGDYGSAIENFEYVIEHFGGDDLVDQYKRAFYGVGRAYYQVGDYELAIEYLDRYAEFDDESKHSYYLKTIMYFELEKVDEALRNLQLFNKSDKTHDAIHLVRGIQHFLKKEYEAALEELNKSRDYPFFKEFVHCFRASCQRELGNLKKGVEDINQAIKLYPECILALMTRGDLYHDLGLEQKAINDYEMVIAHYEKNMKSCGDTYGKAFVRIGMIHFEHGDYRKAFPTFDKASEQNLAPLIDLAQRGHKPAQDYLNNRDIDY